MTLGAVLGDLIRGRRPVSNAMLSVVVNFHNNRREAANTLYSMTREYQLDSPDRPLEVSALNHGSHEPLAKAEVSTFGPEFRYEFVQAQAVSPVRAVNACHVAAGEQLLVDLERVFADDMTKRCNIGCPSYVLTTEAALPPTPGGMLQPGLFSLVTARDR